MTILDDVAARVDALEAANGRDGAIHQMLTAMAQTLERLSSKVATMESVPERLDALERSVAEAPPAKVVTELVKGSERMMAHLDRLSAQVGPLQAVPKRMVAVEGAQGRLGAVEKALAGLISSAQQQSADVAALKAFAERVAALEEVAGGLSAIEPALADFGQGLEEVRANLAPMAEVVKKVEALEQAGAPPSERLLTSVTKRLDRLSTQAALIKEVPDRLDSLEKAAADGDRASEALERLDQLAAHVHALQERLDDVPLRLASLEQARTSQVLDQMGSRNEALSRGLGGAIDMIDQLSHQITLLEHTVHPEQGTSGSSLTT
ncbi:MAG: hypothetical protein ACR2G7_03785 [Acidimicrobiales bacterium]